jgi:hypothetical protein
MTKSTETIKTPSPKAPAKPRAKPKAKAKAKTKPKAKVALRPLLFTEKPNKPEALEIVMALRNKKRLTDKEIDTLVNFFRPPASHRHPKNSWQWLSQIVSDKVVERKMLHGITVKAGQMYATDGHRAYWAPAPDGMDDGFYDPTTKLPLYDDPEIAKRVVDLVMGVKESVKGALLFKVLPMRTFPCSTGGNHVLEAYQPKGFRDTEWGIQKPYLDAAKVGHTSGTTLYTGEGDEQEPNRFYGKHELGEFVIMGVTLATKKAQQGDDAVDDEPEADPKTEAA